MEPVYVLVWNDPTGDMIDFTSGFFYTKDQAKAWIKNNINEEDQKRFTIRTLIYGLLPLDSEDAFYKVRKYPRIKGE